MRRMHRGSRSPGPFCRWRCVPRSARGVRGAQLGVSPAGPLGAGTAVAFSLCHPLRVPRSVSPPCHPFCSIPSVSPLPGCSGSRRARRNFPLLSAEKRVAAVFPPCLRYFFGAVFGLFSGTHRRLFPPRPFPKSLARGRCVCSPCEPRPSLGAAAPRGLGCTRALLCESWGGKKIKKNISI